jgi:hypothetical protein
MAEDDVADLVSQHRRELIHPVETFATPRLCRRIAGSERVEVARVHKEEMPVQVAPIGHASESPST